MKSQLELSVIPDHKERDAARAQELASWLLSKLERKEIEAKKKFGGAAFYLEVSLLSSEQMDKNVLSFEPADNFPRPDLKLQALGEIHLNPDYIRAHEESFEHMLIHGFLHLLGYEHGKRDAKMVMEQLEERLLEEFSRKS
ncbi:MAG: rRNA maturation RNase YbeY [Candidatus Harrisonbacteria bacterium]|nr:rRNA maturation RNase YbeY [Candidatus Harrisonbacteria bacterium]